MANDQHELEEQENDHRGREKPTQTWTSSHTKTFCFMYLAYATGMGTRGSMDLAFFGAQKDNILSLRQFSAILTSGTAAYATGKLLGGPIVDYAGGRSILTTLTALMGVCFISIGRTTSPIIMSILWSFSRLEYLEQTHLLGKKKTRVG